MVPFALSLIILYEFFGRMASDTLYSDPEGFAFYLDYNWLTAGNFDINFTMAVDGISIYLIMLTTLIFPLSIYFSWDITKSPRGLLCPPFTLRSRSFRLFRFPGYVAFLCIL